ncbi:hypothetical protein Hanom_Chr05g00391921 [Helianthus anomalus]
MKLRSSPAKDPKKDSPLKSQGITKNPSLELCRFTNPEIDRIRHCFLTETIFRSFDSSLKSDCISDTWVAFPTTPFLIGFSYPFPAFTQSFFALTGMCYIQAMPMMWRVLYTIENIIEQEGIEIGMSELTQLYNRFLFKHKPGDPHPILKTTKNDTHWKSQFFFVRRDSIPDGKNLPKKWITHAISLSFIQEIPATKERVATLWSLDPVVRTFQAKVKDSQEVFSGSFTMSSKYSNLYMIKYLNENKTRIPICDLHL